MENVYIKNLYYKWQTYNSADVYVDLRMNEYGKDGRKMEERWEKEVETKGKE
jgi:hypothetical protein